jgi:uncharacterized protein (UPF0335 family)
VTEEVLGGNAQSQLKAIVERVERVQEDIDGLKDDQKEIFLEAKGNGFEVKILKKIIRLRKMTPSARQEEQAIMDLYLAALGEL